ncbi:MAG: FecR family protein [bacterium]
MHKYVIVLVIFAFFLAGSAYAADPSGTITKIIGDPQIKRIAKADWSKATRGDFIYDGDQIKTGDNSRIEVVFLDGTALRLNRNSFFQAVATKRVEKGYSNTAKIESGEMWFYRQKIPGNFIIESPISVATIKGTEGDMQVASNGDTTLIIFDGRVEFGSDLGKIMVTDMQKAIASRIAAPKVETIETEQLPTWQKSLEDEKISKEVIIYYREADKEGQLKLTYKKQ